MKLSDAERAVLRLSWRGVRRSAIAWSYVFASLVVSSVLAYGSSFSTAADRARLAAGTASNSGLQALFGEARSLDTVHGFTAWRCGGLIPPIAAILGLMAATRLLRGQEDSGRWEILVVGIVTRVRATALSMGGALFGGLVAFVGLVLATAIAGAGQGFSVAESGWFALAMLLPGLVFTALGALLSQLSPSRRQANGIGIGLFALAFFLRVVADGSAGAHWVRWLTPLGWAEQMHPLTGAEPGGLVLGVLATAALAFGALRLARGRDLGGAVLARSGTTRSDLRLLSSVAEHAFRFSRGTMLGWAAGVGAFAFMFGLIARGVVDSAREALARAASELGGSATPDGYIGFGFIFIVLAVSIYAATLVGAAREEEASGRLDDILIQPISRARWLASRLGVALSSLFAAAGGAAFAGLVGGAIGNAGVSPGMMLAAGANTLPAAILFLGLTTLIFGFRPRETTSGGIGLVVVSFLLATVGGGLSAPPWLLDLSVFHHIAIVPGDSINVAASIVMVGIGFGGAALGLEAFRRRDLAAA